MQSDAAFSWSDLGDVLSDDEFDGEIRLAEAHVPALLPDPVDPEPWGRLAWGPCAGSDAGLLPLEAALLEAADRHARAGRR